MFAAIGAIDAIARETMLFAGIGLLIGGIDDLAVDAVFLTRRIWHRGGRGMTMATLPRPARPGRIAVFVAAWDEVAVIGAMLENAVQRFDHPDYRIYVGLYPNDRPTIDAAARVAAADPRIRLVVGARAGPTTKADCLNTVWHALRADDAAAGIRTKAIVLHDAEDYVHAHELTVFDALIEGRAVVQLPVVPLVHVRSKLVSGHYADEFADSHARQMVVRTALGAGMPLAGTGCAIAPAMLARIAAARGGDPFDSDSLTEDYELGLRIGELGGGAIFARVRDAEGDLVAVRAYFPTRIGAAVRQKARWMTGIALAGWDRTGWAKPTAIGDHWMRMRDRRAPLAVLVLGIAYCALVAFGLSWFAHWFDGGTIASAAPDWLIETNGWLLLWRLSARMTITGRSYGWREALWSIPRFLVGNYVALLSARHAMKRYLAMLRGAPTVWEKTCHAFPDESDVAAA